MQLVIQKDQDKKMMGGVSFVLSAKVNLTDEEKSVIKHYKAEKVILHQKKNLASSVSEVAAATSIAGRLMSRALDKLFSDLTIGSLVSGVSFKCKDIGEIIDHEEQLKSVVAIFYNYLQTMIAFGGTQTYNLPDDFDKMTN